MTSSAMMSCCAMTAFLVIGFGLYGGIMCAQRWAAFDRNGVVDTSSTNCTLQTCTILESQSRLSANGPAIWYIPYNISFTMVVNATTYRGSSIVNYPSTTEVCTVDGHLLIPTHETCWYDPEHIAQTLTLIPPSDARFDAIFGTFFFFAVAMLPCLGCGCWAACIFCDQRPRYTSIEGGL